MIKLDNTTLYSVEDLSSMFHLSKRTIRKYLKAGKIGGRKLAGRWFVADQNLKDYFKG